MATMFTDPTDTPQPHEPNEEMPTLAEICSGDAEFDFEAVGFLYAAARDAVSTDSEQHALEMQRNEILDTLLSYLNTRTEEVERALGDQNELSASQAQRASRIVIEIYDQYSEILNWPEEFSYLASSFRVVGQSCLKMVNSSVVPNTDILRSEFNTVVQGQWEMLDVLRLETDSNSRTEGAKELSQMVSIYFQGSVDIEAICAWRLGKEIRSQFRKIGKFLEAEFSVTTELPEVPMDSGRRISEGNKIPLDWSRPPSSPS